MPGCAELLVVLPFVLVGWLARRVFRETNDTRAAWLLFLGATIVLIMNCAWGYHSFESLAAEKKWTAASFALVRTALFGIVVAGLFWIAGERIIRIRKRGTPPGRPEL